MGRSRAALFFPRVPSTELSQLASVGKHTIWADGCPRQCGSHATAPLQMTQKNNVTHNFSEKKSISGVSSHDSLKHPTNISFTLFVLQRRATVAYTRHLHHTLLGNSASWLSCGYCTIESVQPLDCSATEQCAKHQREKANPEIVGKLLISLIIKKKKSCLNLWF